MGFSCLGRLEAGEMLPHMAAQDVPDPRALGLRGHAEAREQVLLARVLDALHRPAHGEALEEELDLALPGVLARPRGKLGVRAPRRRRHRAAQLQAVVGRRRRPELLGLALARAPAHYLVSAARSSCSRTLPVSGSAWPGHAAAGSSAASLRIEARACSVSRLNADSGTRGWPLRALCGSRV